MRFMAGELANGRPPAGVMAWAEVGSPQAAKQPPGRNDPCPCGSGKKFKKCCGADPGWQVPT